MCPTKIRPTEVRLAEVCSHEERAAPTAVGQHCSPPLSVSASSIISPRPCIDLGLIPYLKMSFRTTNGIEALNSQVGHLTRNVKVWKNSAQRERWLAAALLDIEPRLHKVKGVHYLPLLRQAIQTELKLIPKPSRLEVRPGPELFQLKMVLDLKTSFWPYWPRKTAPKGGVLTHSSPQHHSRSQRLASPTTWYCDRWLTALRIQPVTSTNGTANATAQYTT